MKLLLAVISAAFVFNFAWAENFLPKRTPGLWKMTIKKPGEKRTRAIQQCVGPSTDEDMMQMGLDLAGAMKQSCEENSFSKTSDGFTSLTKCQLMGSTMVSKGVFRGDHKSQYAGTIETRFTPAFFGHEQQVIEISARRIAECPEDMNPGDMIAVNGRRINSAELAERQKQVANDPRIKQAQKLMNNPAFANAMKRMQNMSPDERKKLMELFQKMNAGQHTP